MKNIAKKVKYYRQNPKWNKCMGDLGTIACSTNVDYTIHKGIINYRDSFKFWS